MKSNRQSTVIFIYTLFLQYTKINGRSVDEFFWSLKSISDSKPSIYDSSIIHFRSFSCVGREDGIYPNLATGCSTYFRCFGGAVYSYVCPEDKVMNWKLEECVSKDNYSCPTTPPSSDECISQSDGLYPNYLNECHSYYSCENGTVTDRYECPNNFKWDILTGSCGEGPHVSCSPPACWGLSNGNYPLSGSQCSLYYTCEDGVRTDHVCPYSTVFDYMKKKCVDEKSAICYDGACDKKSNGYYSFVGASCGSHYRCFNGAIVELGNCPDGEIFDGETCVNSNSFTCCDNSLNSCYNLTDGLHPGIDSDCSEFYACRNNQIIKSFKCKKGLVFDGKECIKNENFICPDRKIEPNCFNKSDGYHTVEKSNCQSFIKCRNGKKESEHACPDNYVFNGKYCIDSKLYKCPATLSNSQCKSS